MDGRTKLALRYHPIGHDGLKNPIAGCSSSTQPYSMYELDEDVYPMHLYQQTRNAAPKKNAEKCTGSHMELGRRVRSVARRPKI